MTTATATAEVRTVSEVAEQVQALAPHLDAIAKAALQGAKKGSDDRFFAASIVEAAVRLSIQIRGYGRQLVALERRRIEGYVLGYEDRAGKRWYLHHALHWGNLMRCDRVESAALWPDLPSLRSWCVQASVPRGEDGKGKPWPPPFEQLDDPDVGAGDLHAYPVEVAVGEGQLIRRKIQSL